VKIGQPSFQSLNIRLLVISPLDLLLLLLLSFQRVKPCNKPAAKFELMWGKYIPL
jgi:hypothetical protein